MIIIYGQTTKAFAKKIKEQFKVSDHTADFIVINGKQIMTGPLLEDLIPPTVVRVNMFTKERWAELN